MGVLDAIRRKGTAMKVPEIKTPATKMPMMQPAPVLGRVAGLEKEAMVPPTKGMAQTPKSALLRRMLGMK